MFAQADRCEDIASNLHIRGLMINHSKIFKLTFLGFLAASSLFAGCAVTPSVSASRVQDADAQMVASCKYVGEVQGSSGWGGLAASAGMENAKSEARESATKLGATHILWNNISGGWGPSVSGKAYQC